MNSFVKIIVSSVIFYLLSYVSLYGQSPFFSEIANQDNFNKNRINCILQDQDGFIWVGTEDGVYISDGINFTKLALPDSISSKNTTALFNDAFDNIWLGFINGNVLCIDKNDHNIIQTFTHQIQSKINCIEQIDDQTILFGSYGQGIYILKNNQFRNIDTEEELSDNFIYSLLVNIDKNVWVGTDNGINIIDFSNDSLHVKYLSVSDGLPDFIVKSIKKDDHGQIWIGMHDKGICSYDPATNIFTTPINLENWTLGQVQDILPLSNSIWIATENKGIVEYIYDSHKVLHYKSANNINLDRINSLMQDKEGNIWLTNKSRIILSLGSRLEFIAELQEHIINDIQALTVDKKDNIWVASAKGVFKYNPNTTEKDKQITRYPLDWDNTAQKVMSLYEDPYKYIWIGTFGNGIIRLNPETGQQVWLTEKEGLINGNVLSINSTQTNIWFATLGGVSNCEINSELANLSSIPHFNNFQKDEGLGNNFIYHLYPDNDNRTWFATDGSGIVCYSENGFESISEKFGFTDKIVYSVTGDRMGNIWMNVANDGLYKYDGENISKYFNDPDHKSLSFSGILTNSQNELIIAFDDGIDVLNTITDNIIHFESNAGLDGSNPNLNTISIDSKDDVWIGTSKGLVKYSPSPKSYISKPHSIIYKVAVFLEKINHIKTKSFSYNNNHLSFSYAGLWYQYPERVEYQVKLEGHDLSWIDTKNNNIVYSNLKPGEYSFHVKSALYGNFNNAQLASYSFTIRKPFWSATWFYSLMVILVVFLIYFYIKYRENKLQKKQEAIKEKIRIQFENLKSQINPHFLFNSFSTLIALIESNSEEAVDYVQDLSNLFRNVLESKDEDLIELKTELDVVGNYINLQKKRFGNNLEIEIQELRSLNNLLIPPLTLQLLIENAIKHNVVSKSKPLNILILIDSKKEYIFIKNKLQEKEKKAESTGIGLNNIVNRYKILTDKNVEIIKTESEFIVGLPYILKV